MTKPHVGVYESNPWITDFYAGRPSQVPYVGDNKNTLRLDASSMFIEESSLIQKVIEVYQNIKPAVSNDGKYKFELSTINDDANHGDVVTVSTYSSSLTGNAGNAVELAVKALLDPDHRYTYVASPGNGLTSALSRTERKEFARSGSMMSNIDGTLRVFPFIEALGSTLQREQVVPIHLAGDSIGGIVLTALAASSTSNSVESIFQNVRTGFVDLNILSLAKFMLLMETKNGNQHAIESPDRLKMNSDLIQMAKLIGREMQPGLKAHRSPAMLGATLFGLSHGENTLRDLNFVKQRNEGIRMLSVFNEHDILCPPRATIDELVAQMGDNFKAVYIVGGSHSTHTHYPLAIDALRRAHAAQ